jgi:hypothetical protein
MVREAGMRREGDHNFWWLWMQIHGYECGFVATNKGILAALV